MKMGIKDFRERLGQLARGEESVELTDRGKVIGTYTPRPRLDLDRARAAAKSIQRWQDDLRARGVDPEDWLAELGLDPYGMPLDDDRTRTSDRAA